MAQRLVCAALVLLLLIPAICSGTWRHRQLQSAASAAGGWQLQCKPRRNRPWAVTYMLLLLLLLLVLLGCCCIARRRPVVGV